MPVETALLRLLGSISGPLDTERVPLDAAAGRVLAEPLAAKRTQPPFAASAMDGYAVRYDDAIEGARLRVLGEVPAGYGFADPVVPGTCVRIFTGAPVPEGADAILIQEDAQRDGDKVTVLERPQRGRYIRPAGLDFSAGEVLVEAGKVLDFRDVTLAAAMNHATVPVRRRPRVALLATGDELVEPGNEPGPEQIVASNGYGLAAMVAAAGGAPSYLGIAPDDKAAIAGRIEPALAEGVEILVTMGGASVGDHDLVQESLTDRGMTLDFWRIAMRPGKPLMFGRLGDTLVLGLPGNPVSSLVCGLVFLRPMLKAFLGLDPSTNTSEVAVAQALPENDRRQDYLRARIVGSRDGRPLVEPFERQDSSMLAVFNRSNALVIRPPHAPALAAGGRADALIL